MGFVSQLSHAFWLFCLWMDGRTDRLALIALFTLLNVLKNVTGEEL